MPSQDAQVAVIGAGVVGCAVAHACARRGISAVLLEAAQALATGASATNSGILHTGFDSHPGELETQLILRAAQLREQLLAELGLPVWRCGAMLIARSEEDLQAVARLAQNARENGVEAYVQEDGSLVVPGETVSDPLAFVHALAAAAKAGGARVRLGARVSAIRGGAGAVELTLEGRERLRAAAAINCAGLRADEVARLAGEQPFALYPRKGEFLVFAADRDLPLERILLPVPSSLGKGVLVFPTLDGRHVIAGPTAREREDRGDDAVEPDAEQLIRPRACAMYPPLERLELVGSYAGLRPAGRDGANYAIVRSQTVAGLVHAGAIRSTGLSASLAIAEHMLAMLAADGVLELGEPRPLPTPSLPRFDVPWWRWAAAHRERAAPG